MKVIIVDDEIYAVTALVNRMDWTALGFDPPLTAHSMAQAQSLFQSSPADLMLCDIEMPQGSGLELFEWVKSYYPRTECIFVTCHDEYSYLRSAMQLGSCDYVLKPVDYAELTKAVSEVVKRLSAPPSPPPAGALPPLESREESLSENPYVRQIVSYVSEHVTEPLSIPEIADVLHLNPQYMMRLFKKETGCSILQYVTSRRISLAVRYLEETSASVTDVSMLCGFDNYSYFTRIFKRCTGESPASYRKNAQTLSLPLSTASVSRSPS